MSINKSVAFCALILRTGFFLSIIFPYRINMILPMESRLFINQSNINVLFLTTYYLSFIFFEPLFSPFFLHPVKFKASHYPQMIRFQKL